ncbi:uncharacterized protein B0H18DRAFT_141827 [Fomitopsis serialis]|uniref:uncharacterized protein n=1 Tax=Fomitopsis serialis TaxID=139415 RepID=UPI002007CD35|nr:uncharacterized protein B0H18DRAFT_141827 [Neoantrodia serialis]KAH9914147.1 hypothetical protein B0H18DRAFT_141827 [Neoantrodia serialis]
MGPRTGSAARKQASATDERSTSKRGAGKQDRAKAREQASEASSGSDSDIPTIDSSRLSLADRQTLAQLRKMAKGATKSAKVSLQKTSDTRKRSAAMMNADRQDSSEEERQPRKYKKKKVVQDSDEAEHAIVGEDVHVNDEITKGEDEESGNDSEGQKNKSQKSRTVASQPKAQPKSKPKRKLAGKVTLKPPAKLAKSSFDLDDDEAAVAQSLAGQTTTMSKAKTKTRQPSENSEDRSYSGDESQQATQAAKKAQPGLSSKNKLRGSDKMSQTAANGKGKDVSRVVSKATATKPISASDADKSDDDRDAGVSDDDADADADADDDNGETEKGEEEERSEIDEIDDDDDVVVLRTKTANGQGTRRRSTRMGTRTKKQRAKMTDLPTDVRALVSASQNCLRLRIALKSAWTSETSVPSDRLPERNTLVEASLNDAHEMRDKEGRRIRALKAGFQMLAPPKKKSDRKETKEEKTERKELQKRVSTIVWACASQLRNELRKKAESVIEPLYGLRGLSAEQRSSAAAWLLKAHPTQVNDGTGSRNIPNFVFSDISLVFDSRKRLDVKASHFNEDGPFRHPAIYEVIFQHWALGARADANLHAAIEEFAKVPDNLIALVCNAVSRPCFALIFRSYPALNGRTRRSSGRSRRS